MRHRRVLALLFVATVLLVSGCDRPQEGARLEPFPSSSAALAAGLHDLDNGTVQALGTLEYRNVEGGIWVLVSGASPEGEDGDVVAVIANPDGFTERLEELGGKPNLAEGTRQSGASTRMAGPEVMVEKLTEASDTLGAAE